MYFCVCFLGRAWQSLRKQQESLQSISSPEDFVNFMQQEGMSNEDIQRMLTDPSYMESWLSTSFTGDFF